MLTGWSGAPLGAEALLSVGPLTGRSGTPPEGPDELPVLQAGALIFYLLYNCSLNIFSYL
jgi:hypothetical protein